MSRKLINGLAQAIYSDELDIKDLFFIIDYDKILLKEVIFELYRLGYNEAIEKLMIEQSRNLLEFCYEL